MSVKKCLMGLSLFLFVGICAADAHAAWSTNPAINNAICVASNDQDDRDMVSDGSGGAIITWWDGRNVGNYDIYAQRIDSSGVVQWTANGVAICTEESSQAHPAIISDGSGGAIITWPDYRNGSNYDIYAQRIDSGGVVQWAANGVPICQAAGMQDNVTITSDGSGGAIITWDDNRNSNKDIYAQRINAGGSVQWAAGGVPICTIVNEQENPLISSDGSGGAIITWRDHRDGNTDIYAQRIDASGAVQWAAGGAPISTAASSQDVFAIISDGGGGAIISWEDSRNGNTDIYAQRINAGGGVQWAADGAAICIAANNQSQPTMISDGSGGAIITWYDSRGADSDIYARRINGGGVVQWTADGVAICTAGGDQYKPTITSDGSNGAIITWHDERSSGDPNIYAQRINAGGGVLWTSNGVAICTAAEEQGSTKIISDGSGGAIITWYDYRNGSNYDIYAQMVNASGALQAGGTASIPTLNEWGIILFMLLMGASAIFFLKRMKTGAHLGHP